MNEKDMNKAILAELIKIADRVFVNTKIKDGTYTAAELAKGKDSKNQPLFFAVSKEIKFEKQTVSAGNFKCSFYPEQVFSLVWRFEKLAGVNDKGKKRFCKTDEFDKGLICSFSIDIEKNHLTLCKLAAKDSLRPVMGNIFIDTNNCCLVACDGHAIKEITVKIESDSELPKDMFLYIDPKHIKNMVGRNRVDVYPNEGYNRTVVTNESTGVSFENYTASKYPYYRSVYPKLRKDGYIRIAKDELKPFIKFCKANPKVVINSIITLHINKDSNLAILSYEDTEAGTVNERGFRLDSPANMTIRIGFNGNRLYNMREDWNGGLWLSDPSVGIVLDYDYATIGVMMPMMIEDSICPDKGECNINPLERNRQTEPETTEEEPEAEPVNAASAEKSIGQTEEIQESKGQSGESGEKSNNPVNNPVGESGIGNSGESNYTQEEIRYRSGRCWIRPIGSAVGIRASVGFAKILQQNHRQTVRTVKNRMHRIRDGTLPDRYTERIIEYEPINRIK